MQFVPRWPWSGALAAQLLVFAAGCSGNGTPSQPMTDNNPKDAEVVQIKPVDLAGYNQNIEQLKGKVIVVDWWFLL